MQEIFSSPRAAELKALLGQSGPQHMMARTPLGHAEADEALQGGLRHGVLHEVFATSGHEAAATGFVAGLTARIGAGRHSLWIRQDFSVHEFGEISPLGLAELGIDPGRMLQLSVPNPADGLRAANDAMSCAALGSVVIEMPGNPKVLDLVASRRLTLAAMQTSVTALLLRFSAQPEANTADTRWLVQASPSRMRDEDCGYPSFDVSLIRSRQGRSGRWVMEWNCDECVFQDAKADNGPLVSAPADRQGEAA